MVGRGFPLSAPTHSPWGVGLVSLSPVRTGAAGRPREGSRPQHRRT